MAKPALPTLIKLAEQQVEHAQALLADVHRAQTRNTEAQAALKAEVDASFEAAAGRSEIWALQDASRFQDAARTRQTKLAAEAQELVAQETSARATLQAAYVTQKRYETLYAQQQRAVYKAREKRAQAQLDEMATFRAGQKAD